MKSIRVSMSKGAKSQEQLRVAADWERAREVREKQGLSTVPSTMTKWSTEWRDVSD